MAQSKLVALQSVSFPNMFLRVDATDLSSTPGSVGGAITGQTFPSAWETFRFHDVGGGQFAFESDGFPGVFLRMDGSEAISGPKPGVVNCRRGDARSWEKFRLRFQNDGTVGIESVAFEGVFLSLDGQSGRPEVGQVSGKHGLRAWEKFYLWVRM